MDSNSSSSNIQKLLHQILSSKNWSNILLRTTIRDQLKHSLLFKNISNASSATTSTSLANPNTKNSQSLNERVLFDYLHSLDQDQLVEFRDRVFKLAKDNFYECMIVNYLSLNPKPVLKKILPDLFFSQISPITGHSPASATRSIPTNSTYILRCNLIRDIIECVECVIDPNSNKPNMPSRCTEYEMPANNRLNFPLGKSHLITQLNAIKVLHAKLMNHQNELLNLKEFTYEIERLESGYLTASAKCVRLQNKNQFLKFCLIVLSIVVLSFLASFMLMNCFTFRSN